MGLDIYYISDRKRGNCLITLSRSDLVFLEKSIFSLKEKTGVYIDAYGTTKLYPDHGKILLSSINCLKVSNKNIEDFLRIIQLSIEKDEILILEGD